MICPSLNGPYPLATSNYYSTVRTGPVLSEKAGQAPTSVCYPSAICVVSYVTLLILKNAVSEHLTTLSFSGVLMFRPQEQKINFEGTVLHINYGHKMPSMYNRFGTGIYTSSVSSSECYLLFSSELSLNLRLPEASDYTRNINGTTTTRALLLNRVIVGNPKKRVRNAVNLIAPPPGCHSVRLHFIFIK